MPVITPEPSFPGAVRVRAVARDPLEGLRGHDYIAARCLNQPVQRLDVDPQLHAERIENILAKWKPRANVIRLFRPSMQSTAQRGL